MFKIIILLALLIGVAITLMQMGVFKEMGADKDTPQETIEHFKDEVKEIEDKMKERLDQ